MYTSLSPGAIGVQANLEQGLQLAAQHGFDDLHFSIAEVADLGLTRVKELREATGIRLSAFGFPVDFRGSEQKYEKDLGDLFTLATLAAELGALRTSTYLIPFSDELNFRDNFTLHRDRLRPVAEILADFGIRFGLEYVAPDTMRVGKQHLFVHTMEQTRELCEAIGTNVGFLIDSWHWYNARETSDNLRSLSADLVVDVHVNDAPDRPLIDQVDHQRAMPGETGVIDIVVFLNTLRDIGYDGPVMAEPFSEEINGLPDDEACAETITSLRRVLTKAGL